MARDALLAAVDARCLDDETLAAWTEGALLAGDRERAVAHLEGCESCRALASELALAAAPEASGLLAGRYRLETLLGEGAAGSVWSALDVTTNDLVAVKVLRTTSAEARARLLRELAAGHRIQHDAVASARAIVVEHDEIALVSELLDGETLQARLTRARPSVAATVALGIILGDGLAAIHEAGIVHRDIKPANLFVPRTGGLKIIDLGLAKLDGHDLSTSQAAFRTATGTAVGTPLYMSPEQARGETTITSAADVWGYGVVVYECLTGARPFEAKSLLNLLVAIERGAAVALATRAPHLERALVRLVDAMLEVDASRRPSASEAADAFRALADTTS